MQFSTDNRWSWTSYIDYHSITKELIKWASHTVLPIFLPKNWGKFDWFECTIILLIRTEFFPMINLDYYYYVKRHPITSIPIIRVPIQIDIYFPQLYFNLLSLSVLEKAENSIFEIPKFS